MSFWAMAVKRFEFDEPVGLAAELADQFGEPVDWTINEKGDEVRLQFSEGQIRTLKIYLDREEQ